MVAPPLCGFVHRPFAVQHAFGLRWVAARLKCGSDVQSSRSILQRCRCCCFVVVAAVVLGYAGGSGAVAVVDVVVVPLLLLTPFLGFRLTSMDK